VVCKGSGLGLIPFIPPPECFFQITEEVVPSDTTDNRNSDELIMNESPAHVLANWVNLPDVQESEDNVESQSTIMTFEEIPIQVPSKLTAEQKHAITQVLESFVSLFTKRPGLCTLDEHTIDTGSHKPIKANLRPMTPAKRKIFDETFF